MPAQTREARRNYIDLVSDESERHGIASGEAAPVPHIKAYLLKLVAEIFRARGAAS